MEQDRETLCQVCLLLYQRGYVVSNDGNVSVRIGEDQVLITPSGVSKGRLTPDMLVVCDLEGRVLAGRLHPSSESAMHLLVYRERPDVGAVVHAHPPAATAFSICRRPLAQHYLTETITIQMGNRMEKNPDVRYYPIEDNAPRSDYVTIDETTEFEIDEEGNPVILFPAGTVTDEAHGEQSFRIPKLYS